MSNPLSFPMAMQLDLDFLGQASAAGFSLQHIAASFGNSSGSPGGCGTPRGGHDFLVLPPTCAGAGAGAPPDFVYFDHGQSLSPAAAPAPPEPPNCRVDPLVFVGGPLRPVGFEFPHGHMHGHGQPRPPTRPARARAQLQPQAQQVQLQQHTFRSPQGQLQPADDCSSQLQWQGPPVSSFEQAPAAAVHSASNSAFRERDEAPAPAVSSSPRRAAAEWGAEGPAPHPLCPAPCCRSRLQMNPQDCGRMQPASSGLSSSGMGSQSPHLGGLGGPWTGASGSLTPSKSQQPDHDQGLISIADVLPAANSNGARGTGASSRKRPLEGKAAAGAGGAGAGGDREQASVAGSSEKDSDDPDAGSDCDENEIEQAGGGGAGAPGLTLDKILAYAYTTPIDDAAKALGVGLTTLKKACRRFNLFRWPYRRARALEKRISKLRDFLTEEKLPAETVLATLAACVPGGAAAVAAAAQAQAARAAAMEGPGPAGDVDGDRVKIKSEFEG
eukprot:tig00000254_g22528.t1